MPDQLDRRRVLVTRWPVWPPWRWRFYLARRGPEYGWNELMLGFVSVIWAVRK